MPRDDIQPPRRNPQHYEPPAAQPEKGGTMTVLKHGAPQEVAPPEATGAGLDRSTVSEHELASLAPVKGDARAKNTREESESEPPKPAVWAEVLETRVGVDDGVGGRVTLRAGKKISDQQYNLKRLHDQGVKLRKLDPEDAPRVEANPFA